MDVRMEPLEACKLAEPHFAWMKVNGYAVPPLPGGESPKDLLAAAVVNDARTRPRVQT